MAKNWTAAEAAQVIVKGEDKAAIQDIARRFPLFAVAAASGVEGLLQVIGALPDHMTTRKIESVLKADVEDMEDDEEEAEEKPAKKEKAAKKEKGGKGKKAKKEEVEEDEEEEEEEKPKKGKKGKKEDKKNGKGKKKPEPEEEEDEDWDDEEESEDEDGFDDMSLAQLKKEAKKQKINVKGMDKDAIIAALRGEEPEDDEDEDDEDEDWDI